MLMSLESRWGQANYVATAAAPRRPRWSSRRDRRRLDAVTLDQVRAAGARMLAGPRAERDASAPGWSCAA